jgi:hypothetical protein
MQRTHQTPENRLLLPRIDDDDLADGLRHCCHWHYHCASVLPVSLQLSFPQAETNDQ